MFVFVVARQGGPGREVLVNALVNNATNFTLLLGLPAALWGMTVVPRARKAGRRKAGRHRTHEVHRLSLMFTMLAVLFFTGAVWALSRDGKLDLSDGLVLMGLFVFWQVFELFDVLKGSAEKGRRPRVGPLVVDLGILAVCAYGLYLSIDALTTRMLSASSGFLSVKYHGWLSGWLMVIPNAMLALYYGWKRRPEVVYSSQFADAHICIPLCIGLFACLRVIRVPAYLDAALLMITLAASVHLVCVGLLGRLPRAAGIGLMVLYGIFLCVALL